MWRRMISINDAEVLSLLLLSSSVIITDLLHAVPVLEAGLEHAVLEDADHHVHVEALPLHSPQGLLDGHQRGAVSHRASTLLHFILDAVNDNIIYSKILRLFSCRWSRTSAAEAAPSHQLPRKPL